MGTDAGLLVEFPDGLGESQAITVVDNGPESRFGRLNGSVVLGGLPYPDGVGTDCQTTSTAARLSPGR
ncbi:MAG: hypothetical protein R3E50_14430 [Halioglobus sp.]